MLVYSAEIAGSDNHLIVTQNATDNASLVPRSSRQNNAAGAHAALTDSGFLSLRTSTTETSEKSMTTFQIPTCPEP